VPRLINRICDRALQRAHVAQAMQIDAQFVWTATSDLGLAAAAVVESAPTAGSRPNANPAPVLDATAPRPAAPRTSPPKVREFPAQGDLSLFPAESDVASGSPQPWAAAVAGAILVAAASFGTVAWYTSAQASETAVVAQPAAPRPPDAVTHPISAPLVTAPPSSTLVPPPSGGGAVVASATPAEHPAYSILVASFGTRDRAQSVVDELTNAGFDARAVDLAASATHAPLVQVRISGYTAASAVQRDLELIRQLPGRYNDARIVEQNQGPATPVSR
jgi:hypothetical protein